MAQCKVTMRQGRTARQLTKGVTSQTAAGVQKGVQIEGGTPNNTLKVTVRLR